MLMRLQYRQKSKWERLAKRKLEPVKFKAEEELKER